MNRGTQSIDQFLEAVASENVTPAAGSVTAVVGAAGASLLQMVCLHSRSADRPADVLAQLDDIGDELRARRADLLRLAEADANAVDAVLDVPDNRSGSREAKRATGVPLAIAESCLDVLTNAPFVLDQGTQNAVPDGITGVLLTHRAVQASTFIVRTNIGQIDDSAFRTTMDDRTAEIEAAADDVYRTVIETDDYAFG